jgi:hypothetical protein
VTLDASGVALGIIAASNRRDHLFIIGFGLRGLVQGADAGGMLRGLPDIDLRLVAFFAFRSGPEVMRVSERNAPAEKAKSGGKAGGRKKPRQCGCFHRRLGFY